MSSRAQNQQQAFTINQLNSPTQFYSRLTRIINQQREQVNSQNPNLFTWKLRFHNLNKFDSVQPYILKLENKDKLSKREYKQKQQNQRQNIAQPNDQYNNKNNDSSSKESIDSQDKDNPILQKGNQLYQKFKQNIQVQKEQKKPKVELKSILKSRNWIDFINQEDQQQMLKNNEWKSVTNKKQQAQEQNKFHQFPQLGQSIHLKIKNFPKNQLQEAILLKRKSFQNIMNQLIKKDQFYNQIQQQGHCKSQSAFQLSKSSPKALPSGRMTTAATSNNLIRSFGSKNDFENEELFQQSSQRKNRKSKTEIHQSLQKPSLQNLPSERLIITSKNSLGSKHDLQQDSQQYFTQRTINNKCSEENQCSSNKSNQDSKLNSRAFSRKKTKFIQSEYNLNKYNFDSNYNDQEDKKTICENFKFMKQKPKDCLEVLLSNNIYDVQNTLKQMEGTIEQENLFNYKKNFNLKYNRTYMNDFFRNNLYQKTENKPGQFETYINNLLDEIDYRN